MLNSKHGLGVLAMGFVCSSLCSYCAPKISAQLVLGNQFGIRPEPAGRALLLETGRESASLGSLALQPTPTCCFLGFIETSLLQLPASNNESKSALRAKTRGGTWVVWRVGCAVAQHDFPQRVLGLFLLDLLPLLTVKHLRSIFWQLLMGTGPLF